MTEIVLQGLVGIICFVFIDDIIIYAASESEFLARLRLVLQRLKASNIVLKGSKCQLGCPEVKFLGFIADSTGIRHDPTRCSDFLALPLPSTKKGLRSFLGLGNFFRDFVPGYSTYSKQLSKLLTDSSSIDVPYTESARAAFETLKLLIGSTEFLHIQFTFTPTLQHLALAPFSFNSSTPNFVLSNSSLALYLKLNNAGRFKN